MKARHKRLALLLAGIAVVAVAAVLVFNALGNNLSYFFSPSEVMAGAAPKDHIFRLGGLVENGSVQRGGTDLKVRFVVTDNAQKIDVVYTGILPDLFQEGQGVIAQGRLGADGVFIADQVLAKHDENYMPPEVADALSKAHAEGVANAAAQGK